MLVDKKDLLQADADELMRAYKMLESSDPGSDAYKEARETIRVLRSVIRDDEKADTEEDLAYKKLQMEAKKNRGDRWMKVGEFITGTIVSIAGIILPIKAYDAFSTKILKFEKDGYVSSAIGKNLINKIPFPNGKKF